MEVAVAAAAAVAAAETAAAVQKEATAAAQRAAPSRKPSKRASMPTTATAAGVGNNTRRSSSIAVKRAASQRKLIPKVDSANNMEAHMQASDHRQQRKMKKRNSSRNLTRTSSHRNMDASTKGGAPVTRTLSNRNLLLAKVSGHRNDNPMVDASGRTMATAPPANTRNASTRNLMVDSSCKTTATAATTTKASRKKKIRKSKSDACAKKLLNGEASTSRSDHGGRRSPHSDHQKPQPSTGSGKKSVSRKPSKGRTSPTPISLDSKLAEVDVNTATEEELNTAAHEQTAAATPSKSNKSKRTSVAKRGRTKTTGTAKSKTTRSRSSSKPKKLQRSNSLDSNLNQDPHQLPVPAASALAIQIVSDHHRPTLAPRKASSRRLLTSASGHKSHVKRKSSHGSNHKPKSSLNAAAQPALVRSNSLDSMLSSPKPQQADNQNNRPSLSLKKASFKRAKSLGSSNNPKEAADDKPQRPGLSTKKASLRRMKSCGENQQRPGLTTKKASLRRLKSLDAKTEHNNKKRSNKVLEAGPPLARSNSLDSMLDLSKTNREHEPNDAVKQRPTLSSQRKGSSRRFKNLESKTDHNSNKKRLSKSVRSHRKSDRRPLVRSNSLDSVLDSSNREQSEATKETAEPKQRPNLSSQKNASLRRVKTLESKTDHTSPNRQSTRSKSPRPSLGRSNSLDSKLSSMSNSQKQHQVHEKEIELEIELQLEGRPSMKKMKKVSLRRLKSVDQSTSTNHDPARPTLTRSNSLDSKLESLSGEEENKLDQSNQDESKNESLDSLQSRKSSRHPSLGRKLSSRRSLVASSDHSVVSRQGRGRGSRRASLSEHLASAKQNNDPLDHKAIAANGYFMGRGTSVERRRGRRSNSVDSHRIVASTNPDEPVTRDELGSSVRRGLRRVSTLAGNDANHALKVYMDRAANEDKAAQEQKNAKREKLSNIQKTFQSIAKEQSKFTDTLLATMSALSRVPSVTPSMAGAGAQPNAQGPGRLRRSSTIGEDGRPLQALKRGTSISNITQRMKDLGSNFRITKKQSVEQGAELERQRRASVSHLSSDIPLLMAVNPAPNGPIASMIVR